MDKTIINTTLIAKNGLSKDIESLRLFIGEIAVTLDDGKMYIGNGTGDGDNETGFTGKTIINQEIEVVPGEDGITFEWLTGTTLPNNSLGKEGDLYLNTANGDVYKKTNSNTWTLQGNIRGLQGPQGNTGATGPQGPVGATGPQGPQGATQTGALPLTGGTLTGGLTVNGNIIRGSTTIWNSAIGTVGANTYSIATNNINRLNINSNGEATFTHRVTAPEFIGRLNSSNVVDPLNLIWKQNPNSGNVQSIEIPVTNASGAKTGTSTPVITHVGQGANTGTVCMHTNQAAMVYAGDGAVDLLRRSDLRNASETLYLCAEGEVRLYSGLQRQLRGTGGGSSAPTPEYEQFEEVEPVIQLSSPTQANPTNAKNVAIRFSSVPLVRTSQFPVNTMLHLATQESGTWIPVLDSPTGGASVVNNGIWHRVGRLVFLNVHLDFRRGTAANADIIPNVRGLPFSARSFTVGSVGVSNTISPVPLADMFCFVSGNHVRLDRHTRVGIRWDQLCAQNTTRRVDITITYEMA